MLRSKPVHISLVVCDIKIQPVNLPWATSRVDVYFTSLALSQHKFAVFKFAAFKFLPSCFVEVSAAAAFFALAV